jgi:hypothetical protein
MVYKRGFTGTPGSPERSFARAAALEDRRLLLRCYRNPENSERTVKGFPETLKRVLETPLSVLATE